MAQRWDVCLAPPTFQFFVGIQGVESCERNSHEPTEIPQRINLLANQESKYVYANKAENPVPCELVHFLVGVTRHKQNFVPPR